MDRLQGHALFIGRVRQLCIKSKSFISHFKRTAKRMGIAARLEIPNAIGVWCE